MDLMSMLTRCRLLPPSKVALVISMGFLEGGDHLRMRDELFEGETVESLAAKIQAFRGQQQE